MKERIRVFYEFREKKITKTLLKEKKKVNILQKKKYLYN
jgi:hypothetical protein